MGKSTFFSILGKQWFSDSLSISDMRDKTAAEKLLGNWILEISEMNGIRKTEVEVVKSFVTRQDDKFRQAYGVNVESHPRKCIIVGSTNSEGGFLRDVTGNRRFWPVHVPGTGKHHPWQLDCVDQIWSEAIHLYNEGEELFLKGAEQKKPIRCSRRQWSRMTVRASCRIIWTGFCRITGHQWTSTREGHSSEVVS